MDEFVFLFRRAKEEEKRKKEEEKRMKEEKDVRSEPGKTVWSAKLFVLPSQRQQQA